MKRGFAFSAVAALALAAPLAHAEAQADKPADEATKLAVKLLDEGAAVFDTFSVKGMVEFYREDAEIHLVTRNDEGFNVQVYKGKDGVEKAYAELFKKPETIKSKNHVEYAKFLAPDLLVIAGTFEVNTLKPDQPKIPFYQVRVKSGDKWLMSYLRIFFVPPK